MDTKNSVDKSWGYRFVQVEPKGWTRNYGYIAWAVFFFFLICAASQWRKPFQEGIQLWVSDVSGETSCQRYLKGILTVDRKLQFSL